ncbi:MAG: RNA 2',3'-cyclic phosphodiesterase, partial [Candidatus Eisenbacteria bacterium]
MVRTFIALVIPDEWKEYLGKIEGDLMRLMTGLSWVKAENLHVTLRFLGDLGDSGVRRAGEAAGRGAKGHAAFTARLGAPGAFPSMNRPRVLWTGLTEGRDEAIALAKSVNQSLDHGGFGPADKPCKPHIT